jgi:chloramphenicol O-acetyltransferase type A
MIPHVTKHPTLEIDPGRDGLLSVSALPWTSFTSFARPMRLHPVDSLPRFACGTFFQDGQACKIPRGVQGHHALMDGILIARFYARMEGHLQHPKDVPGEFRWAAGPAA